MVSKVGDLLIPQHWGPSPFRTLTLQMPACHYMGIGLDSL